MLRDGDHRSRPRKMKHTADADQPIDHSFLIGGPERREIILVSYDPNWPGHFDAQRQRIETALGAAARRVEHVGSTAVPGLLAKPIIDVLVVIADVEDEAAYLPSLEAAGYLLRVRERGHRMLRTPDLGVHVHLWSDGATAVETHLAFRDQLRASSRDRDRYAAAKRELATRDWPTMNHYADAKTDVIRQVLNRVGAHPRPSSLDPCR